MHDTCVLFVNNSFVTSVANKYALNDQFTIKVLYAFSQGISFHISLCTFMTCENSRYRVKGLALADNRFTLSAFTLPDILNVLLFCENKEYGARYKKNYLFIYLFIYFFIFIVSQLM